ncbi:hypothetical protein I7I48_00166 [Histoplasma ohiense]|nr:hypothetical protein I7I48_00166 [Histoplasma ohiense (nom. inval.)]
MNSSLSSRADRDRRWSPNICLVVFHTYWRERKFMNCFMTSLPKHYCSSVNYSSNILSHFLKEVGKGDRIAMRLQTIIALNLGFALSTEGGRKQNTLTYFRNCLPNI